MNILIQLSHPAHFHLYKNAASNLIADGHQVLFVIKTKDILETLLQNAGLPYVNINEKSHRNSKIGVLWDMLMREWQMVRLCRKHKIDILLGSTPEVAHVGWWLRKWRINTGEDDLYIVPAFAKIASPFIQTFVTPNTCDAGKIEHKAVHYPGFQKLAYLHPNHFTPSREIVEQYGIETSKPYFILRFAQLTAHHDVGIQGINTEVAQGLIDILSPKGRIYITSERPLEPQFEQYRLQINPLDIHHVMAYATLYIGDSQSMAVEAAMLGVPALRFNDFVGKKRIGVLEELEHVYGLTYGISSHAPEQLYTKVKELMDMPDLRDQFQARRQRMLQDKIDVTAFLTWFIEHYPQSQHIVRAAGAELWKEFKNANSRTDLSILLQKRTLSKSKRNILIQLSHPAHFHLYRKVAENLQAEGHQVLFVIKTKDILETLLQNAGLPYVNINEKSHRSSKIGVLWDMLMREWRIVHICRTHHIDLLTGSTPDIAHAGWWLRKWRINTGEDDMAVVPAFAHIAAPFVQCFVAPDCCDADMIESKSTHYPGYHELAYLHPNHFTPRREIVEQYGIETDKPYFILRFAQLTAHHDAGIRGINTEVAQRLIDILAPKGRIYITSERPLEPQFEQYRIHINPLDMHHVMAFASLYIGDSQTMAAEAGVLGVPFVRFNDFVGRIGYLRDLEDIYELGYGIHAMPLPPDSPIRRADGSEQPSGVEQLYATVRKLTDMSPEKRKEVFAGRRERMLSEKIDSAKFLTWFIGYYPQSAKDTKKADAEFWKQFK